MGGSLSDLLTTAKNLVTALNNVAQTYMKVNGMATVTGIASANLVKQGPGRICMVSVTAIGSTPGSVYDANLASATTNLLWIIPNTIGEFIVNMPVGYGIVVAPGTGQVVTVSYS